MSPERTPYAVGALRLVVYEFAAAGDELPLHSHVPGEAHVTFCNKGRVRAWGPGWEEIIGPGEMLVFESGQPHALTALEPSRLTHILF